MSRSQQNADYLAQYNWMPYRNKLINGDFRIDQRYAGTSTTNNTQGYLADRWNVKNTTGTFTKQRVANGPFGNTYSLQLTVATVGTRISTDEFYLLQPIEGNNTSDLQFGYSTAKTCTLSFWVKNSLTGTYGGAIASGNGTRRYAFTYTVSAASTWEYKTVVLPGDVTGGATAYPSDNTCGLYVVFGLGCGSIGSMSAGAWTVNSTGSDVTGTASFAQTLNAVMNISMIQFEVGSVATPFESRPIGVELALCQRYYEKSYSDATLAGTSTSIGQIMLPPYNPSNDFSLYTVFFKVTKRMSPSITLYAQNGTIDRVTIVDTALLTTVNTTANSASTGSFSGWAAPSTANSPSVARTAFHYTASAEL